MIRVIRAVAVSAVMLAASACGSVETPSVCGDGVVQGSEGCDDGNTADGDSCAADCLTGCGDGDIGPGELCDDGNAVGGDGCSAECTSDESCGNSFVDDNEACDDGDTAGGDGCSGDCRSDETCGNHVLDPGEACDDGNTIEHDGCNAVCTGAFREFDGTFTGTWQLVTHTPATSTALSGIVDYTDGATPYIYTFITYTNDFKRVNPATGDVVEVADPVPPLDDADWATPAPDGHFLYVLRSGAIHRFDLSDETWSLIGYYSYTLDQESMTESDGAGHIYVIADHNVVQYDIATGNLSYYPFDAAIDVTEARLAYDPTHQALFFGGFNTPNLHRFDLTSHEVTAVASIPEPILNDIFCGDRSGHIYAAGASAGVTIFEYDIERDMWSQVPDFPVDQGNEGGCMVSGRDGRLYVTNGNSDEIYGLTLN